MSAEDKQFMQIAKDSSNIVDGHYSLRLPFRRNDVSMPDNRHVAEQRLSSLQRKLCRNA